MFVWIDCFRSLDTFCVFADCHIILNMQSELPRFHFSIRISPLTVKKTLFNSLIKDIEPYSFKTAQCLFELIACFRSLNTFYVFAECRIILNMQSVVPRFHFTIRIVLWAIATVLWCCCLSDCPRVEERSFNWSPGSACWRAAQKRRRANEETGKFFIQSDFLVSQSPSENNDDEVRIEAHFGERVMYQVTNVVKSACKPSGSSGRSLSRFP